MSLNLHLEHFENSFTMETSAALATTQVANIGNEDATIDLSGFDVSATVFQETFFIKTDTDIAGDASSVLYYVDKSKWANHVNAMNPFHGMVTTGQFVDGDNVGQDFIREIALQCFGTHLGSDLFTNENEMTDDISSNCSTVADNIATKIENVDILNTNNNGDMQQDLSNLYYLTDAQDGSNNLTKLMFNAIYRLDETRFQDISTNYTYPGRPVGYYKLPFLAGDQIEYRLTISPNPLTFTNVPTKPTSTTLNDRIYKVRLTLV